MANVHGTCNERFEPVRERLSASLDSGADVGASVAVLVDGEPVVDLWGGVADSDTGAPWEADTLVNVWSSTKTMTALSVLILADRGLIDLHAPVATYWPEFAAAGKESVEVRHLMAHTSGLSGWQERLAVDDLYDWERCTSLLAAQEPWWEPGTASGYHAVTQGYLLGEVVRRVTGTSIGQWFAAEVAGPLGADFHIGLPESEDRRVATLVPPPSLADQVAAADPNGLPLRTLGNPPLSGYSPRAPAWRRAEIPAAGGHGNARSIAAVQAVLAGGGQVAGTRLLSEQGCEAVFEEQSDGRDLVLRVPLRFGMGYGLASEMAPVGPRTAYWGGWGGSLVMVDLDTRLTFAYAMNRMESGLTGDTRGGGLYAAAVGALFS